jgi:hypothetical protein
MKEDVQIVMSACVAPPVVEAVRERRFERRLGRRVVVCLQCPETFFAPLLR